MVLAPTEEIVHFLAVFCRAFLFIRVCENEDRVGMVFGAWGMSDRGGQATGRLKAWWIEVLKVMDREQFAQCLQETTDGVIAFTRTLVSDELPDDRLYLIRPNASYDGNPLDPNEVVFPEDSLPQGQHLGPCDAAATVDYLWRDGRVPEWVNVSVHRADAEFTYVELLCCGRFTGDADLLYHQAEGRPPFHGLGPPIPPDWLRDENGKMGNRMSHEKRMRLHGKYTLNASYNRDTT